MGSKRPRRIREHPRFEHTPIIFVTGVQVSALDTLKGYEVGAIDYIAVPLVPQILRSKVALLVELYLQRMELEQLNHELSVAREHLQIEREHAQLLDISSDAIFVWELDGAIQYWNKGAAELYGFSSAQAVGQVSHDLLSTVHPGRDVSGGGGNCGDVARGGARAGAPDRKRCGLNRSELDAGRSPWHAAAGVESQSRSDRTQANGGHAAGSGSRRKDEFIAMLAHELRNPLVPIRTGIGLLQSRAVDPNGSAGSDPAHHAERQMAHVVRLIDDLLDAARITSGRIGLQCEPVTLSSLVEAATEAHRETIAANGTELTVEITEPDQYVYVDSTRFVQVISNLLSNAARFTPRGGRITVAITTGEPNRGTRELVLRVTDTGMGISPDRLPRIFDLFGSASSDLKELGSRRGLGVGLALARRIAQMHGGTLEAHSEGLGRGAEFILRAPVVKVESLMPSDQEPRQCIAAGTPILVVDDSQDSAELMVLLLQLDGRRGSRGI